MFHRNHLVAIVYIYTLECRVEEGVGIKFFLDIFELFFRFQIIYDSLHDIGLFHFSLDDPNYSMSLALAFF